MALDPETKKQIDDAVEEQMRTLRDNLDKWSAKDLLAWYKKAYIKATYKYLGQAMVALAKEQGL